MLQTMTKISQELNTFTTIMFINTTYEWHTTVGIITALGFMTGLDWHFLASIYYIHIHMYQTILLAISCIKDMA